MNLTDLVATAPADISTWTYRVYGRIRGHALPEREWRRLFEFGVETALQRRDMAGLHAMVGLAASYFDSIGDQFGCLPYIEATMERVMADAPARAVVLAGTYEILVGNS